MENQKKNIQEEEINNPEQFQIGRNHPSEAAHKEHSDSTYTRQENEFADGKGSKLAEAFDDENIDEEQQENTKKEE